MNHLVETASGSIIVSKQSNVNKMNTSAKSVLSCKFSSKKKFKEQGIRKHYGRQDQIMFGSSVANEH